MIWKSIFMLVGKLVATHFELVASHHFRNEMEAVLPPTYPHISHLTGWSNAIDHFYLKLQLWCIWVGFIDDAVVFANASHEQIKVTSGTSLNASEDFDKHFQACWKTCHSKF